MKPKWQEYDEAADKLVAEAMKCDSFGMYETAENLLQRATALREQAEKEKAKP